MHGSFFGQSSFASTSLVRQCCIVNVTGLVRDREELKMLAPLGCGLQTGAGTVLRVAKATGEDSVAVLGLGGVGLAAVMVSHARSIFYTAFRDGSPCLRTHHRQPNS